jgi:PBSX family phage terminase large subunit
MIGKTLDSLKRNIINPIQLLIGDDMQHYPGKREIHLWDRIIYTIGANDERSEGKIRGATAALCLGDEISLWPESFWMMLDSRLSLDSSVLYGTTNPDNPKHYLKKMYLDRIDELDLRAFHFKLDDNPYISDRIKAVLKKNYVGLWYKRFILGLWCIAEGAIFDFFDEDEHTLKRTPKADYYIIAVDYGTSNPFAALLMGVNHSTKPKIWAEREFYFDPKKTQRQKTDGEFSSDLMDFTKEYLGKNWRTKLRTLYIDPSAESFQLQLEKDGFDCVYHADNDVSNGLSTKATMLKRGEYAISRNCPNYIEEMFGYMWDDKAQAKGIDKPRKENDHCQDAGRYGVYTEFGNLLDLNALTRR